MSLTKVCQQCPHNGPQPLSNFHTDPKYKYGVKNLCKVCCKTYNKKYQQQLAAAVQETGWDRSRHWYYDAYDEQQW
jgi:hypothetical protein